MNGTSGMDPDNHAGDTSNQVEGEFAVTSRATYRVIVESAWQADRP